MVKSEYQTSSGFRQLLLLGIVGAAAGLGGFLGNALGARLPLTKPELTSILALASIIVSTLIAVLAPGLLTATVVGLVGSTGSSLAKVCLDSVIQANLPEASRASAFGRSESALQLSWVFGGVIGLLIGGVWSFGHSAVYSIGFSVVTVLLAVGFVQCVLTRQGRTLVPAIKWPRRRSAGRASAASDGSTHRGSPAPPRTSPGLAPTESASPGSRAWSAVDPAADPPSRPLHPLTDPPFPPVRPASGGRKTRKAGDPR